MTLISPDDAARWVSDSNEATTIRLFSCANPHTVEMFIDDPKCDNDKLLEADPDADIIEFHPSFTYPIYGELERIFGYKNLGININYAAGSLKTFLQIKYKRKIDEVNGIADVALKPDMVEEPIKEVLSPDLVKSTLEFAKIVVEDTKSFKPHGKKLYEYKLPNDDCVYEIYEGGQFIDDSDEKWTFYTLYKKTKINGNDSFSFVGFTSMYNYFHWPDKIRARISQFLILPLYQQYGHGSKFYSFIRTSILSNPSIVDFTVEDPNELFDDLRDKNDIRYLILTEKIEKLQKPVSFSELADIFKGCKFGKKQMVRIAELCLLRRLNKKPLDSKEVKEYRIWVKKRLFRQNYDVLIGMSPEDRKAKLAETYDNIIQDYNRILSIV
ncbi:hypothetical protein BB560_000298 [Smittium megazygosporum]|uniref:Histone acetyltransferase type B catalytic subunit n=1 Tax=Smittium megazygosporum TaxID=133381 RepID=A0A2T9ZKP1_9FUNG|nr:hypothetical protein BB560_000298 [Smittium megazygosporum]